MEGGSEDESSQGWGWRTRGTHRVWKAQESWPGAYCGGWEEQLGAVVRLGSWEPAVGEMRQQVLYWPLPRFCRAWCVAAVWGGGDDTLGVR